MHKHKVMKHIYVSVAVIGSSIVTIISQNTTDNIMTKIIQIYHLLSFCKRSRTENVVGLTKGRG